MNKRLHAQCDNCGLKDRPYVPRQKLLGPPQHPVLFLGQAPGEIESLTKEPFTGPAGKMHYGMLREANLNKLYLNHDNICSCWPPAKSDGGDRVPEQSEAFCCFPGLKQVILDLKPELIIALGDFAMQQLTGLKGIQSQRGRFRPLLDKYDYKCTVLCCLHPSFVRRQRQWYTIAVQTYRQILKFLSGEAEQEFEPELILDPSADELEDYLSDTEVVYGTDTETTGLDVLRDEIIGHSFSKDNTTAVAVKYKGPDDPRRAVVEAFLKDPKKLKCWQNGSYDTGILQGAWEIRDRGFAFDTRLAQQLLDSDLPSSLDFLRGQYTKIKPYKPPKASMKHMIHWETAKLLKYACLDAVATKQVMEKQLKLLSEKELDLMKQLLIPLVRTINEMEYKGVLVDKETLAALYMQCRPVTDEIEQKLQKAGLWNCRSNIEIKKFFGTPNAQALTLQHQINRGHSKSNLIELLLRYKKLYKLQSTYLVGAFKRLSTKGRMHTHYKIEGTGTGRLSSENPNLQNVPEEMRVIYIPDPGCEWISADYDQIELWIVAILAEDDQLLHDLQIGRDVHEEMRQLCFPHGEKAHRERVIAKSIVFGTVYGRSPWSIARAFAVTVAEAKHWQYLCVDKYPKLLNYKEQCEHDYAFKGYLETPFGRRRKISSNTQGYNFRVQSAANDVMLNSLIESDQKQLDPRLTVHDEIVFCIKKGDMQIRRQIKEVMERKVPELNGMSFGVSYKTGDDWYNMEEMEI